MSDPKLWGPNIWIKIYETNNLFKWGLRMNELINSRLKPEEIEVVSKKSDPPEMDSS